MTSKRETLVPLRSSSLGSWQKMTLGKAGLLSLTVPAILATWLAAEAATESSRDNLSSTIKTARANTPIASVSFRDGLLSIEVKAGTWRQVLNAITEQTGIRFHHALPLEGSVTVSFANLPVRQAIERLFGPEADFVFRYRGITDSSASLQKEVWVLGNVRDESAGGQQSTPSNKAGFESNQADSELCRGDKHADASEPPMDKDLIDHFVAMSRDEDPEKRRQGVAALTDSGTGDEDGALDSVLDAALTDEDASVRAYGVQAIAKRGGPEARGHLWRALRDPDAEVRVMVVESVEAKDYGIALLQEALSDVDKTVRWIAADRMKQDLNQAHTD